MSDVTIERLNKCDLCFEDTNGENLYDYDEIDTFIETTIDDINCTDEKELKNAFDTEIQKAKHLMVFEKDYFNFDEDRLIDTIIDYGHENFDTSYDDYDVTITDRAKELIKELTNEINEHNKVYHTGASVGFIDLSKELMEAMYEDE